jgi:cytochrome c-type biogenesis protein CcmE
VSSDHAVDEHDPGSGVGLDDAADTGIDLRPRTSDADSPPPVRRRRNPLAWLVLAAVVVGLGFVVLNGLSGATLYFRNADEAVAQRDELGTRRFRLQGLVVDEPEIDGAVALFTVEYNDVAVPIRLTDGIPDMFQVGRPAVMEGHFAEGDELLFLADEIFVKHDEVYEEDDGTYEEEHPDRVDEAEDGEADR